MTTDLTGTEPARHHALYRRFRAQTFGQIVGQVAVVETLRNAIRLGRLGHGFLFVGPRGTGKTSMARILAKAVNCTELRDGEPCDACPSCVAIREGRALDVVELDAASNNRVDDMRELLPRVYTAASDLRRKVFIIDEVQRIKEGWDVLLKTLEEPPDGVLFVFCTTDPSQIRPAVVSRLQRFTFRPLSVAEIEGKLARIVATEGRAVEPGAAVLIARLAAGGMRDAESMLDQVLASAADPITETTVGDLLGLAEAGAVDRFVEALAAGDALAGIGVLDSLEAEGRDLVAFSEQVVARVRERLVEGLRTRGAEGPELIAGARRLTGIDASRSGLGGYRWQLELALLSAAAEPRAGMPRGAAPAERRSATPADESVPVAPRAAPAVARPAERAAPPVDRAIPAAPPVDRAGPAAPAQVAPASPPAAPPAAPARAAPASPPAAPPAAPARVAPASPPAAPPAAPASPEPPSGAGGPVPSAPGPLLPGPAVRPAAGGDLLEQVLRGWGQVVAQVGRNPANRPIVTACRPVEVRDGVVVLGFPENQAFLRDHAERKRAALEEGIAAVVGRPVGVRCVVANLELVEADVGPEGDLVAQARRIFEGDLADVDEVG
jgi:DNA polymerase-3 subunit gamma/tau